MRERTESVGGLSGWLCSQGTSRRCDPPRSRAVREAFAVVCPFKRRGRPRAGSQWRNTSLVLCGAAPLAFDVHLMWRQPPPPSPPRPFSLQALLVVHTPLAHCRPPPPPSLPVPLAHRYLFRAVSSDGRGGRVRLQHMERTLVSLSRRSASVSRGLVLCPDPLLPATQPLRPRFELAAY